MRTNETGIAHVAVAAVVVLALIAGTGVYVFANRAEPVRHNADASRRQVSLAEPLPTDLLGLDQLQTLATEQSAGAQLASVQLEKQGEAYVYKVKLVNGRVLFYNAQTGALMTGKSGREAETEDSPVITAGIKPTVSFAQARETALAQVPGGVIRKIQLEMEDGNLVYSVRFTNGARVDVNAVDGAVTRTKVPGKPTAPAKTKPENKESHRSPDSQDRSVSSDDSVSGADDSTENESGDDISGGSGSSSGSGSGNGDSR